ncbi:fungal hydrophobin-domain-containing protein [Mycena rosella]|uniref:Hydrophobin n=1 Tax=Mycena rosella TaxID=1033263 RepID=A0AAD7M7Z0_MYCRO|nr:fungal hydrophobin-domain-containing protein [Mycena rosella]
MLFRLPRSFAVAALLTGVLGATTVTVTAPAPTITSISQCNTGDAQCCNTVVSASDPQVGPILGLLGIVLSDSTISVGLDCTPITIIGIGQGANCAQQPVCCTNNGFNGLISIGCTPISL